MKNVRDEYVITFDKKVFNIDTVKRALYRLADSGSFDILDREGEIYVAIHPSRENIEELKAQIRNEVIDQDLRDSISLETRDIRTLILANAFSNTGLIDRE